jgi:hypothetical protein
MEVINEQLQAAGGPYFLGAELSLVDITFVPMLERAAASLAYYKGAYVRGAGRWPAVDAWFDALETRSTYMGTKWVAAAGGGPVAGWCQWWQWWRAGGAGERGRRECRAVEGSARCGSSAPAACRPRAAVRRSSSCSCPPPAAASAPCLSIEHPAQVRLLHPLPRPAAPAGRLRHGGGGRARGRAHRRRRLEAAAGASVRHLPPRALLPGWAARLLRVPQAGCLGWGCGRWPDHEGRGSCRWCCQGRCSRRAPGAGRSR